jgi:hypothetical protein
LKKVIIILTLILPLTCDAKFGWSFTDYSLLAGQQYRFGQRPLWSFEFQYDKFSSSCLRHTHYKGIGVSYNFNDNQTEFGLKGMWNPTNWTVLASRSTKFYPYLFGQGNFIQTKTPSTIAGENKQIKSYSFRPGLGLTGNFLENKVLNIRTYLQLGYNIPSSNGQNFKNSLTLEFKLGFGINSRRINKNHQKEIEAEEQETK